MGKGKLAKFADMEHYDNVFQYPYSVVEQVPFDMKGHWRERYFNNQNPIILELGCGKGEYTVGLARLMPEANFIGVDIKGARMWTGATQALQEGLRNVAFLRTNIEVIDRFFAPGEVQQIWLTFSDPQMKNPRKRLSSTYFLERYRRFLQDGGIIHLKTDSQFLFTYTRLMAEHNRLPIEACTSDLYECGMRNVECGMRNEECGTTDGLELARSLQTYYEGMWLERGIAIKYLRLRLPHEGRLEESDIEIPLDDYRSYKRDKRSSKDKAK
jgi:tRNA (guanine-N7-)-methyltransferase